MNNVYIVSGDQNYLNLFHSLGMGVVAGIEHADLVCFTGGEDVTPSLYGDAAHAFTGNNPRRDEKEKNIFDWCSAKGIPMVGICRGAQFLNVMNGGRMYQHVDKHAVYAGHAITDTETGDTIHVSSTHHQMMMPAADARLIAFANEGGSREWFDGHIFKRDTSNTDYEVLFYEKSKSLCFQPHPEFTGPEWKAMRAYFHGLLNTHLIKEAA